MDDRFSTQKALQTVAAGQQAENLLYVLSVCWRLTRTNPLSSDFDDAPAVEGRPSGLAATEVLSHTPAAANLLAGTSSNPLDDLVSIFGAPATPAPPSAGPHDLFNGLSMNSGFLGGGAGSLGSPAVQSPSVGIPPTPAQPNQQPQDDLLGLF